jgi:uncharacterized protein (DUF1697 family)
MRPYVAFLRAVNVGGKNRLPMPELRTALTARGFEQVSTVLQSGNVLFHSTEPERVAAATVGDTIEKAFGLHIGVVVRAAVELIAIADRNPFLATGKELDPATLHVAFLSVRPAAAAVATLESDRSPPDAFVVDGREVYLSYPNGSGRTRLTLAYLERRLKAQGTARNWRTVQRLAALLEG